MNIAKTSLLTHQTAIDLTGANIANVNTAGYTQQRAMLSSLASTGIGVTQTQTGVQIDAIERVYDRFLASQITGSVSDLGYSEMLWEEMEKVEMIFNESLDGGVADMLNRFWGSWEDLSANPSGQAERVALLSVSESLASLLRSSGQELVDLQGDINLQLSDMVIQANSAIDAIADLNMKIMEGMSQQGNINDLLDKRTEALNRLAGFINFNFLEDASGAVNVYLAEGTPLVTDGSVWRLEMRADGENSFLSNVAVEGMGADECSGTITGGNITALLDMRDEIIGGDEGYLTRLDAFVAAFVKEVNAIHNSGYDTYKNAGEDFFLCEVRSPGQSAPSLLNIRLSDAIASDVMRIAASKTVNGDGANALAMSALKDAVVAIGAEEGNLNDHYAAFVSRLGQDVADSERTYAHQGSLMKQMENKQQEMSGVSIDEEMMNLIKFQMGYQSAARLCTVAEEMIDTLMGLAR